MGLDVEARWSPKYSSKYSRPTLRHRANTPVARAIPNPAAILVLLRLVDAEVTSVCNEIDKALDLELEHAVGRALKKLRKGVESLKSDTMVYKVLLSAVEKDTDLKKSSPYAHFIQRYVMGLRSSPYAHRTNNLQYHRLGGKEAMKTLESALKATRTLLKDDYYEIMMDPSGSKKSRVVLGIVLDVLNANFRPGDSHELTGELKDVTNKISVCQQDNERTFKLVWYYFVTAQQWTGRCSVDNIGNIQDRIACALDSVLTVFADHPFAVSPEIVRQPNVSTFAILNRNHETATRHEKFVRRIGKAWVDDRVNRYYVQVRQLAALQTSLFELLWSGTVEQLKRHSPYSDDPERPRFEGAVEELERGLRGAIIRLKNQRFAIAFCGTVEADKSLVLNALMGRAILPSDSESNDSRIPHAILSITADLRSTAWPCRLRHVEGQKVPELRFQAEPFLVALKELQDHQYGRKMQTYQLPREHMFETLFSDAPPESSENEISLKTIHSQWVDLHAVTRGNLLKFETPGFQLPRVAHGEREVKSLVCFVSC